MKLVTVFVGAIFLLASSAGFAAAGFTKDKGNDQASQVGRKKTMIGKIVRVRKKPPIVVVEPQSGSAQLQTQQTISPKKPKRMAFWIDDGTVIVGTGGAAQKGAKGHVSQEESLSPDALKVGQTVRVVYVIVKPTLHQTQGDHPNAGQKPHQNQKIKPHQKRKPKPGKKQKIKPGQDAGDDLGQFDDDDDEVGHEGEAKGLEGGKGKPGQRDKVKPGQRDKVKPGQRDKVKPGQQDQVKPKKRRPRRRLKAIRIEILTSGQQQGDQDK